MKLLTITASGPLFVHLLLSSPAAAYDYQAFFARHCTGCHGADDPEGDLRLDNVAAFEGVIRRFPPREPETRRSVLMEEEDNIRSVKKNKGGVIETHGPLDRSFPSEAQKKLFGESAGITMAEGDRVSIRGRRDVRSYHVDSTTPREDAERIICEFAPRAFRRPVDEDLADPFVELALSRLDRGSTFEQAVRAGVCPGGVRRDRRAARMVSFAGR